ncbi:(2Fe-2S)-binding protein [Mycobacterium vicinigordonae]|uniref:(2Fe-2S)-binding protein n=1 Tax=Mycobacterium vicinigordonae TaxID=1719132 RepID=A0A7D6E8U7_9MYCO|nr:(2Fe-2S)-binding protein [Mycobacterium vicinigordonae]QLL09223.1 (2Fe-2S)-binding protein [Mycobacterium vicinigordonae]
MSNSVAIELRVNGTQIRDTVPARMSLVDFLRDRLRLTGTHIGCHEGMCGTCNVLCGSHSIRACLMLAAQADGADIVTIEGLSTPGQPSRVQESLVRHRALQCGFCTPGFVVLIEELLADVERGARPDSTQIREHLNSSLCRCTGYTPIVAAAEELVANLIAEHPATGEHTSQARPSNPVAAIDSSYLSPGGKR